MSSSIEKKRKDATRKAVKNWLCSGKRMSQKRLGWQRSELPRSRQSKRNTSPIEVVSTLFLPHRRMNNLSRVV